MGAGPDAVLGTASDKVRYDVFTVGAVHDGVVGVRSVPERKAALVMRRQTDFARANGYSGLYPLLSGHVGGVEDGRRNAGAGGTDAVVIDGREGGHAEVHELGRCAGWDGGGRCVRHSGTGPHRMT